jgi:hypothetical protein
MQNASRPAVFLFTYWLTLLGRARFAFVALFGRDRKRTGERILADSNYSELDASLEAAADAEAKGLACRQSGHWQDANQYDAMRDDHFGRALELDGR